MTSFNSLNENLRTAAEQLEKAANEIHELQFEPVKQYLKLVGEALANILQIQHAIYRLHPELKPEYLNNISPTPDGELTCEQEKLIAKLSKDEIKAIDDALYARTCDKWRKVARIVGETMFDIPCRVDGIPDVFYSQRVKKLVSDGLLESQGDLRYMGFSEVRRISDGKT